MPEHNRLCLCYIWFVLSMFVHGESIAITKDILLWVLGAISSSHISTNLYRRYYSVPRLDNWLHCTISVG
ncbi:uncharacterized protein BO95DRAFT_5778 [Aspergillus brunneoviolaceus CBS 621.78]|uniref:Uncharacterized protein n=1 Tax=Aspergillus brunneoviolaceus CBS 621.78 TaxID=1450534 RepID=A0ACD1GQU0_9EURO|nr:hypothetical protein BO95DRAFT_5778 [Aspergillus brunneoviolaceus CBS 621.78]RAH51550.1 hypothetical protein BO95DRAFT_5778 [Aspergillus brunneoviolaceus CBS 621.78]